MQGMKDCPPSRRAGSRACASRFSGCSWSPGQAGSHPMAGGLAFGRAATAAARLEYYLLVLFCGGGGGGILPVAGWYPPPTLFPAGWYPFCRG